MDYSYHNAYVLKFITFVEKIYASVYYCVETFYNATPQFCFGSIIDSLKDPKPWQPNSPLLLMSTSNMLELFKTHSFNKYLPSKQLVN
jgi:hypothetical protein